MYCSFNTQKHRACIRPVFGIHFDFQLYLKSLYTLFNKVPFRSELNSQNIAPANPLDLM